MTETACVLGGYLLEKDWHYLMHSVARLSVRLKVLSTLAQQRKTVLPSVQPDVHQLVTLSFGEELVINDRSVRVILGSC